MTDEMRSLQKDVLNFIVEFARERLGVEIGEDKKKQLCERLIQAIRKDFCDDISAFSRWFVRELNDDERVFFLARYVTVSETYFFRDFGVFTAFRYYLLPELIEQKRVLGNNEIRLWCAGCSTGEEAYSLAMIFDQAFKSGFMSKDEWVIYLKGTDISPDRIAQAREGVYYSWSFRGTMPPHYLSYFSMVGNNVRVISPEIREMVKFEVLNLMDPVYPSRETETENLDCIFCRNVFLYLRIEAIKEILRRFYRCLVPGGWLVVAAPELHFADRDTWERVVLPGATFLRKKPRASSTALSGRIFSPWY
ncbi:CheR family methyltransferase [Thermodesulforhabdus norvegica]|uniref:Methylase of chemotaxis methyl-accepting proteins n=1 Tax=Thermodesulforhabdus norvegica TaxID=39841 RepID=A0A1I4VGG2_9BACT|nr:protein-glutamate O-methyltransferase CheR [Thermodesulforhabdus norvegica]SFN00259.1 Methylase of chemotaxis methyl-accepting proteins [Thermodesulforhabdus norvegica]